MVALLLLASGATASAADRVVERQMLEDPSGQLSITDVIDRPFRPMSKILSGGYSDSAFWLRVVVAPRPGGEPMILRVWPTYLDSVTLYEEDGDGGWSVRQTGDTFAYDERLSAVSLGFEIAPETSTTYYLRLKTTSTSLLAVEALEPTIVYSEDLRFGIMGALLLGLLVAMLAWGAHEYTVRREQLMLWYVLAQLVSLAYSLSVTGYLAVLLPFAVLDGFTSLLVCLAVVTQTTFYLQLLRGFDVPRLALLAFALLPASVVPILLLLAFGEARLALQLNAVLVMLAPPMFALLAFLARRDAPPGLWVLRATGVLQSLSLVVSTMPLLGMADATELSRHGILLHGLTSGVFAFLILLARARQMRRSAHALAAAERQLQLERREHDVRGRFLAILAHELRTPLSVVRLSLEEVPKKDGLRDRLGRSVDSMEALIDLSAYAERLEQGQLRVAREAVELDVMLHGLLDEQLASGRVRLSPMPPLLLHTDPQLFELVLRNLVDNALKHSPADSVVLVSAGGEAEDGRNGVAVAIENRPRRAELPDPARIFDKFYRGPGASSTSGLGLGLYLVRGLGELLDCSVRCKLEEGRIRFEVWHPC